MLLDTSVIVELFKNKPGSQRFEEIFNTIGSEPLYISVLQIGEISEWAINNEHEVSDIVNILNELVNIIPLNNLICIRASMMKQEMHQKGIETFGLMDGLVLCSAMFMKQKLFTVDPNFREAEEVTILE